MALSKIDIANMVTGTLPTGSFNGIQSKAGYFTFDMGSGSNGDTQAITGVGFTPKAVFINCLVNAGEPWSVGMQGDGTGTNDKNSLTWYNTANNNEMTYNRDYAFGLWTSGSNILRGSITTFGTDGFTVTYTYQNSPSGTAEFMYLAIR